MTVEVVINNSFSLKKKVDNPDVLIEQMQKILAGYTFGAAYIQNMREFNDDIVGSFKKILVRDYGFEKYIILYPAPVTIYIDFVKHGSIYAAAMSVER